MGFPQWCSNNSWHCNMWTLMVWSVRFCYWPCAGTIMNLYLILKVLDFLHLRFGSDSWRISIGVHKLDIGNPWCSWFLYYCALNARVSFLGFSIDFVGIKVLQWCSGFNVAIKDFQFCFGLNVNLWFYLFRFWSLICLLFSFYGFNLLIPFAIHLVFAFVRMMLILGTSDGVDV